MIIQSGEHAHFAELMTFMMLGERLAHDCAKAQVTLAPERRMQTFLSSQARQEGCHALLFQGAIRWLSPRSRHSTPLSKNMIAYRNLLEDAIARQDFAETLLAEQIILEGLGEAILKKIEAGFVKRGAPFQRLRRMLIHQEEAHHQFGLRVLSKMLERDEESHDTLRDRTQSYLPLAKNLLFSAQDAFYALDENPQEYWDVFYDHLPSWLQSDSPTTAQTFPIKYAMA